MHKTISNDKKKQKYFSIKNLRLIGKVKDARIIAAHGILKVLKSLVRNQIDPLIPPSAFRFRFQQTFA